MPGRFANLEFSNNEEHDAPRQQVEEKRHDDRTYLAKAVEAARWGRFETGLRMYTRCLEANRAVVPAWVGQVQMLVEMGEHSEARLWSDKALELFRNNGELLAAKAQAFVRMKETKQAMTWSDSSLQSPGSSCWRWQVRGEVLLAAGQDYYDECFRKALAEKDTDWFDRVLIARIYSYYRRASNAMYYLKQAMELEPAHGYVWFEMGNCQAALGLAGAARKSYERCLELRPDYREARTAMDKVGGVGFVGRIKALLNWRIF